MKVFFVDNWKFLLAIILCLIELVFVILSLAKKPIKTDSIKEKILSILPVVINLAEEILGPGAGAEKKKFCESIISSLIGKSSFSSEFLSSAIESILSTPSKKMEKGNTDEK